MEEGHRLMRWLFKSEPDTWSWADQVYRGDAGEEWHGVRNYQARNNMRAMKVGRMWVAFCFFSPNKTGERGRGGGGGPPRPPPRPPPPGGGAGKKKKKPPNPPDF